MNLRQILISAITDGDGKTVNAGYLAMAVCMLVVLGAIPSMVVLAAVQLYVKGEVNLQELGVGVGSVCGGFGVVAGALGMFMKGDKT